MIHTFDPTKNLIIVDATVWGVRGDGRVRMALDTGAAVTVISANIMEMIGYDLKSSKDFVTMTSASGQAVAKRVNTPLFYALGCSKKSFPILCHNFPKSSTVEGLLGLDFLRGFELNINFKTGQIQLT